MPEYLIDGLTVDRRLDLRGGTADRLAKRGKLPHVVLPDGAFRFRWSKVRKCLQVVQAAENRQGVDDE